MLEADFRYLEPVALDFDKADPNSFIQSLRKQIRESLEEYPEIRRAVYVVRMTGSFIIAYNWGNSPVLCIGRGNARGRIIKHIGNWIEQVSDFGNDTQVEIRIMLPRRQKMEFIYKNVEADLLLRFRKKYGSLPYFNRRAETAFAGKIKYTETQAARMKTLLGVGSGKRPWWAIKPTRANPTRTKYLSGEDEN